MIDRVVPYLTSSTDFLREAALDRPGTAATIHVILGEPMTDPERVAAIEED